MRYFPLPDYVPRDFSVAFEPTPEMIDQLGLQLGWYTKD
jgi:hypothetical protein